MTGSDFSNVSYFVSAGTTDRRFPWAFLLQCSCTVFVYACRHTWGGSCWHWCYQNLISSENLVIVCIYNIVGGTTLLEPATGRWHTDWYCSV